MRGIERTTQFKREIKGRLWAPLGGMLATLFGLLATGGTLAELYRDHPLTAEWAGWSGLARSARSCFDIRKA